MANGTLKVENIQTSSGSGTITLGQSGETVTIPTGTTVSGLMSNTPAFHVNTASTSLSNATHTTIPFTTEESVVELFAQSIIQGKSDPNLEDILQALLEDDIRSVKQNIPIQWVWPWWMNEQKSHYLLAELPKIE